MDEKLLFEVITTFCELPSGYRDVLKVPYDGGDGYIYGTDGKEFIAVPKGLLPSKNLPVVESKAALKVAKFNFVHEFEIPLKMLFSKLKRHLSEEKCRECEGSGRVTFMYLDEKGNAYEMPGNCPICNGTGRQDGNPHTIVPEADKPVEELACFQIGHNGETATFFAPRLAICGNAAHLLGETSLRVVAFSKRDCMRMELPGGIIMGCMPCIEHVPDECLDI